MVKIVLASAMSILRFNIVTKGARMAAKKRPTARVVLKPKASVDIQDKAFALAEATMEFLVLENEDIMNAAMGHRRDGSRLISRERDYALARLLAVAGFRESAAWMRRYNG